MILVRALNSPFRQVRGAFYGWRLVGVAACTMAICSVPVFQGITAWFVVLHHQFPVWSRGQMSWAFALSRIEGGLMGPVEGLLVDRLGSRWMALIGMSIVGFGFLIFSQIHELWHLYLAYLVMTLGASMGGWLPMMTMLNSWFIRRRSRAMAAAMEGYLLGGVMLVPALAWAIDPDAERFGWRATAAGIGVVSLLLAFPVSRLVRNRPEEYGYYPDGDIPMTQPAAADQVVRADRPTVETGFTWQEAVRTRVFWLISIGHAATSMVIVTLMVHLGLMLEDRGFSLQTIGLVVATYAGVGAIFTLVGGYVGDRLPIHVATFFFSAIQSLAVFILLQAHAAPVVFLFAVLFGMGFGGRNPLTTAIRGVYFGRKAFATITGISMAPMNVFNLAGPLFAGYMADVTGSYVMPVAVVAVVGLVGSFLFLFLGKPETLLASGRTATEETG